MFWQAVLDILKGILTGVLILVILLGIVILVLWRIYQRYKQKDLEVYMKIFKENENVQSMTMDREGRLTFDLKKDESRKEKKVEYPHQYPKVIPGKPYEIEVILKYDKGEIIQIPFMSYNVAVEIEEKSVLYGKNLYFAYNLVPDQFKKTERLRVPMDGFEVKYGQILGWVGECNDFFILLAKFLLLFNIRINVLNNKIPVKSPENGALVGKYVEHLERVNNGENLFTVYYEKPPSEPK